MLFPLLCANTESAGDDAAVGGRPSKSRGKCLLGCSLEGAGLCRWCSGCLGSSSQAHWSAQLITRHYRYTSCPLPHRAVAKNEQQLPCKEVHRAVRTMKTLNGIGHETIKASCGNWDDRAEPSAGISTQRGAARVPAGLCALTRPSDRRL